MSFRALLHQTVTIVHREEDPDDTDGYGNPKLKEVSRENRPGRLRQLQADEVTPDRDTQVSDWRLYLEGDVTLGALDQCIEGGRTFDVVGVPSPVQGRRRIHHIEATVRLIHG